MHSGNDMREALAAQVAEAASSKTPLRITGGNSKPWFGRSISGSEISTTAHNGVTAYDPRELVITARAGTPLQALEAVLAQAGQMLPFEPPHFGTTATIGGTIACGLSGPRRATSGSARDFVLGCSLINGRGKILQFGGQVIKNVAGYDVSRFVTGAQGTLGLLLEISMKVLPRPEVEQTQLLECDATAALTYMRRFAGQPLPVSATAHVDDALRVRLSGNAAGVAAAAAHIGGETQADADSWWSSLREQTHTFFAGDEPLWRLSVAADAAVTPDAGDQLIEWGGAQRWLRGTRDFASLCTIAKAAGGHATLFRGGDRSGEVNQPLDPVIARLHKQLKLAFDPASVCNRGRLYNGW